MIWVVLEFLLLRFILELDVGVLIFNPSIWEADTGGL